MKVKYVVTLEVEVDCFDSMDSMEIIEENFGVGPGIGIEVVSCSYEEKE